MHNTIVPRQRNPKYALPIHQNNFLYINLKYSNTTIIYFSTVILLKVN